MKATIIRTTRHQPPAPQKPMDEMAMLLAENQRLHQRIDELTLAYKQALEQLHKTTGGAA